MKWAGIITGGAKPSRERLWKGMVAGVVMTALVAAVMCLGGLEWFEAILLDWRARDFGWFKAETSDRVVHIDIDDRSLEWVGRWPWPRRELAAVVDELAKGGASVVGFDILLGDHQQERWEPRLQEEEGAGRQFEKVDDDALLAAAMARAGNVMLPIDVVAEDRADRDETVMEELREDVGMGMDELAARLHLDEKQYDAVLSRLAGLKARVMRERLMKLARGHGGELPALAECQTLLLPGLASYVTGAVELDMLSKEYDRVAAVMRLSRGLRAAEEAKEGTLLRVDAPIPVLANESKGTGFVTYEADGDGVVRSVRLWRDAMGYEYPSFAMALACRYMGVEMDKVRVEAGQMVIEGARMADGSERTIRIPMVEGGGKWGWGPGGERMMVVWPSVARDWRKLYAPDAKDPKQHFPVNRLIELHRDREAVWLNERQMDLALRELARSGAMGELLRGEAVENLAKLIDVMGEAGPGGEVDEALLAQRSAVREEILGTVEFFKAGYEGVEGLTDEEKTHLATVNGLMRVYDAAKTEAERGEAKIASVEEEVRGLVRGTVCLVGFTGTGTMADVLTTSLESKVPGVMVHGAVIHSILTGDFLRAGGWWWDMAALLLMGLIVTWCAARLAPLIALLVTGIMVAGYYVVNGVLLFDYMNVWVEAAGPIVAAGCAWTVVTVYRLASEQRERARITKQFKNYVSPDLVDSLVGDPEAIKYGQHELTCMFCDIDGFTTISQRLGAEKTIGLLNRYLSAMTDRLMDGRGYVNKYMGDAVMAVWSAPLGNADHAEDCCGAVLECMKEVGRLNEMVEMQGMPDLLIRVGISTGMMMVGDCGAPPRRSDYTVIGDAVNLGSRLEQANKQFGTQVLISQRTAEMVKDRMLLRHIGRIIVVGRETYEEVYELMGRSVEATDEQRELALMTESMVKAYVDGDFGGCVSMCEKLRERFGVSKLMDLYAEASREYMAEGVGEGFDGSIRLRVK